VAQSKSSKWRQKITTGFVFLLFSKSFLLLRYTLTSSMESILKNAAKFRKEKGFSYENMALELGISTPAYRKIELGKTQLTVERLYQIADTLQVKIATLLDIQSENYHQVNKDTATGFQKIENFYQENKETHQKLVVGLGETITAQKAQIELLQAEVARLRG
jgi:transcriptional regulator with XRE-family HTH domain